jgi:hypothetical protein
MKTDERNRHLDILARGYRCTRCGAEADMPCTTAKGQPVEPHLTRIDRAVRLYQASKR